ncbi:MAG: pyridoxine 5'-phosphate synthase [Myxococcota bacterium]
MPALLSVNINKVALLRNSRGRDVPNLADAIDVCVAAGAHGITVHPRRDERHIRLSDVPAVAAHLRSHHPGIELNVECEAHPSLIELVMQVKPDQCTLVPVTPGEITSDHGWEFPKEHDVIAPLAAKLRKAGIRSSIFMDIDPVAMEGAATAGVDRVELYTGPYAWAWGTAEQQAHVDQLHATVRAAVALGLGVNAGHDLDAHNLPGIASADGIQEVSIGHALMTRALWVGLPTAIKELLDALGG